MELINQNILLLCDTSSIANKYQQRFLSLFIVRMEVCPVGFFCFDKNTFILVIVALIIIVVALVQVMLA